MHRVYFSVVVFALAAGAAIARADASAAERLFEAAKSGDVAAATAAIADGADANARTRYGATALAFAAERGHVEMVRFLLKEGADPNVVDDFYKSSPIVWAMMNDRPEVVIALIEGGADQVDDVIRQASAGGNREVVAAALKSGKVSPAALTAAMTNAKNGGHDEIVKLLKDAGAKEQPEAVHVPIETLDEYAGRYELAPGFQFTIRRDGEKLMAQLTGQPEFEVYAETQERFFYTVVEANITFERDDEGKVNQVVLRQAGRTMPAKRVADDATAPDDAPEDAGDDAPLPLEAYVGAYRGDEGTEFAARLHDGVLVIGPPNQKPYALEHVEGRTFKLTKVPDIRVTFLAKDGRVTGYRVKQGGVTMIRHRVDETPEAAAAPKAATREFARNAPAPWPQFRGPNASGIADGQDPPVEWNAETGEGVAWKTEIPGLAHSSPIVWGDRLFVTTAVSSEEDVAFRSGLFGDVKPADDLVPHKWMVFCLNRKTGDVVWQQTAHEGVPKLKRHMKASHANCTPATDGKHVVASFASQGLYCYDMDGKLLWEDDLGVLESGWFFDADYQWGFASSPIIFENLVITQCDLNVGSFIAAFNVDTGEQVWRTERDEIPSWGTPTVYAGGDRAELLTHGSHAIRAYDPHTGKELWQLTGNAEVTVATPVIGDDLFYFTSGYPPIRPIYAVKPGGSGDISLAEGEDANAFVAWSHRNGGTYMPTPIVYDGFLYTCANNGLITCYDAKTGEQVYRQRLGGGRTGGVTASPVAADGRIYFTSEDGQVYVVSAGANYQLLATNDVGEVCLATPAICGSMFYVRGRNHVFAFGPKAE